MVCQVTDCVPAYKIRDEVGNVKTVHQNRLFLVSILTEALTPLATGVSISQENITQSPLQSLPHWG